MCSESPSAPAPVSSGSPPSQEAPGLVPVRRALVSVSNKTSLVALAQVLVQARVHILSTGGTFRALQDAGIPVTEVSEYTGFPEIMSGRVKTLHPKIHGALLAVRDDQQHLEAMERHHIDPIDLVVVNLYPFEQTVAQGKPFEDCVENIDVGGPTMIRAAAKNFKFVTVVTDVTQYTDIISELEEYSGSTSYDLRRRLASAAFAKMAAYDAAVAAKFASQIGTQFPERLLIAAKRKQILRYGENPHQSAAFYVSEKSSPGMATVEQVQGKELSYNNLADTDAAFELVSEFVGGDPVCSIIKHANPCGVASGVTAQDAYLRALACDPVSAFGGIVALNVTMDLHVAEEIAKMFIEVVIAPDATAEALALLASKKNLRVLLTGSMPDPKGEALLLKSVSGGILVQTRDNGSKMAEDLTVVSKREPTEDEMKNLLFAWKVCKHVKSNAIVYVKDMATVGTGAGQMSRVDASRIAAWKANEASSNAQEEQSRTLGSVVASDAFFPFADGLLAAADAGATAVIQPGINRENAFVAICNFFGRPVNVDDDEMLINSVSFTISFSKRSTFYLPASRRVDV
ncbi:unnamed protein product [Agarophyton chilense]